MKKPNLHSSIRLTLIAALAVASLSSRAGASPAMSTEDFLNTLGVNTHLDGTAGWDTNVSTVASHLNWIGVRLDRDWIGNSAIASNWKAVQNYWPIGRFWSSIPEAAPADQRSDLTYAEQAYLNYPGLIYALGGPNEEDDPGPQSWHATLPDSAIVQGSLYGWAHGGGRNVPVSQMEFGAGWTWANNWEGDYQPGNSNITQNHPGLDYDSNGKYLGPLQDYTPGGADLAAAHTYISDTSHRPIDVLNAMRGNAHLTTPGKAVAHTEFGDYFKNGNTIWGQYCVMGAFDAAAAGDAAYIVYGLQDSDTNGFYDGKDNNPNPVALYYHTMTTLLGSSFGTYSPGQASSFTPGSLSPQYGNTGNGHLLLQKPTGEFVIADWSEQLMNGSQTSTSDTINFGQVFASVKIYDIENGASPIATLSNTSSCTLSMNAGDTYLVVLSNGDGYFNLVNRWTGGGINTENGFACGTTSPSWWSADWSLQPTGDGYYYLVNRWTGGGINTQNGFACGSYSQSWWSAEWSLQPAGNGYYYLVNRWTGGGINTENGFTCGAYYPAWLSAQWRVTPASN
jgi:hypothetical protein